MTRATPEKTKPTAPVSTERDSPASDSNLPDPILPEILGVATVMSLLGKPRSTVLNWCRSGKLPATKKGRDWQIRKEDLRHVL